MVKNIVWDYEFTRDTVNYLIERMEAISYPIDSTGAPSPITGINIYFQSVGGDVTAMDTLVDYINNLEFNVDIIVDGMVASAGFLFILQTNRNVRFLNNATGMAHLGESPSYIRDRKDARSYSRFNEQVMARLDAEFMEVYKACGLSQEDLEHIANGHDVYMDVAQLAEAVQNYHNSIDAQNLEETIAVGEFELEAMKQQLESIKPAVKEVKVAKTKPKKAKNG